ncbi:hypothetical protein V5799_030786 [Amblyomma americanum]|uniref:Uncharacterized protein n=1 Tax=Amblyomma americanum TaxID=6943 RepID=A0AAQ4EMR7_AMBAM
METKVAALGFLRRLWQKLFRRVEDAYGFRQPPAAAGPTVSPASNNGLVEAVDISAPASLAPLQELGGKDGQQHESSSTAEPAAVCVTSCSVGTRFTAAAARPAALRPRSEIKDGSVNSGAYPVALFYSVNTDPSDLQLVETDSGPEGSERCESGGAIAALDNDFDAAAEKACNDEPGFVNISWQRPLFLGETTLERSPQRCVMGVPVRLDPAVVCDLDSGPFDRSCHESVFYTEVSSK